MLRNLTFNSILWIVMGIFCFCLGAYFGWQYGRWITRMFPLPGGLISTGIGMILCGLTNGFANPTPLGRKFTKVGSLMFLGGLPLLLYGLWTTI